MKIVAFSFSSSCIGYCFWQMMYNLWAPVKTYTLSDKLEVIVILLLFFIICLLLAQGPAICWRCGRITITSCINRWNRVTHCSLLDVEPENPPLHILDYSAKFGSSISGVYGIVYAELTNKMVRFMYRVGQNKPDCFSELITLRRLVVERRVVCQNFLNFVLKKAVKSYTSVSLNILCIIA